MFSPVFFHLAFLSFSVAVIVFADKEAFAWVRGKSQTLDPKKINLYHKLIWVGFLGMVVTGVYMAYPARETLLSNGMFLLKMSFVAVLFVNALVITSLKKKVLERTYASLTTREKIPLFASGAASLLGWIGAFVVAQFLFGD